MRPALDARPLAAVQRLNTSRLPAKALKTWAAEHGLNQAMKLLDHPPKRKENR